MFQLFFALLAYVHRWSDVLIVAKPERGLVVRYCGNGIFFLMSIRIDVPQRIVQCVCIFVQRLRMRNVCVWERSWLLNLLPTERVDWTPVNSSVDVNLP